MLDSSLVTQHEGECMAELTAESAREALRGVIDPEIYQNIVDLGLVYGVDVSPAREVDVTMTLTTPHCPMGPQIIENVEATLTQVGAARVNVNIVWEPMWTPDAMTDDLKRQLGILQDEEEEDEEPVLVLPPPPPPKKKGLLGRLFG
jgi:metal-sulfur cluster biosynthetic enzyme